MRRAGSKDIPSVKCTADLGQPIFWIAQVNKFNGLIILFCTFNQWREQSVIWTDEVVIAQACRQGASLRAHTRIHHIDMDGAQRKKRDCPPKSKRPFLDI